MSKRSSSSSSRSLGGISSTGDYSNITSALRQNAHDLVYQARNAYISPYEEWTSDELRDLLVMYKIPLRDSSNATHDMLVRICDEVFGEEIAEAERDSIERRRLSLEDVVRMEKAARTIQRAYFRRKSLLRSKSGGGSSSDYWDYDEEYMDYELDELEVGDIQFSASSTAGHTHNSLGSSQRSFSCDKNNNNINKSERYRHHSILRRINEQGDDYDEEIEVEWRKPSWKFAKRHERMIRPHRAGKRMNLYDWRKVTLGRHCYAGGCGEQLDLWNEGRTSEFSQFGSGITNYFKVSV